MDKIRLKIYDPKMPINIENVTVRLGSNILLQNYFQFMEKFSFSVQNVEKLRWPISMGLLGVFSLFCILLFIGAIVHSRATLIIFSVCGLFSIILLWLLASIYVTMAVALADFCYKPTPWVQLALNHKFNLSEDISNYYLTCKNEMSPFQQALQVLKNNKSSCLVNMA